ALMLTLLLSTTLGMLVPGISQSVGILCASVFWIVAALIGATRPYMLYRSDGYFLALPLSVVVLLTAHVAISSILVPGADFGRFAGSCAILVALFIGAHFASNKLVGVPATALVRAANRLLIILTVLALAAAAGAPALGSGPHDKPVVIFAEPS